MITWLVSSFRGPDAIRISSRHSSSLSDGWSELTPVPEPTADLSLRCAFFFFERGSR